MKKTYKRIIAIGADKAPHFWTIGADGAPQNISDLAAEIAAELNLGSGKAIVTIEAEEQEVAYIFSLNAYRDMQSSGAEWHLSDKSARTVRIIDTEFENEAFPVVAKRREADGNMSIHCYTADGLCDTQAEDDTLLIMVSATENTEKTPQEKRPVTQEKPETDKAAAREPEQRPTQPAPAPAPNPAPAPAQRTFGGFDQSRVTLKKIFQKLETTYPGEPMDKLLKEHSDMWASRFNYTIEQMMETYRNIKNVE